FDRAASGLEKTEFADDAEFARVSALEAQGRDADAMREWARWEVRFPKSPLMPEARLAEAWNALRQDKTADADKRLTALLTLDPSLARDSRVTLARAFAAYRLGKAADALVLLGTADHSDRFAYLRGLCYTARGDLIRSAAAFQEVAERSPDSPLHDPALFAKANAFLEARAYRGAADEFTRARDHIADERLRAECDVRAAA